LALFVSFLVPSLLLNCSLDNRKDIGLYKPVPLGSQKFSFGKVAKKTTEGNQLNRIHLENGFKDHTRTEQTKKK